jgi:pimeloyl-ACP methyl ester carboxylesterase
MRTLGKAEEGISFEDGTVKLRDGRILAWRWWGEPDDRPVLRIQGMPGSRLLHITDPTIQRELNVRYLMTDRPGFGGSTRKPGRGIADIADDYVDLLQALGLGAIAVVAGSAGGPHALALAARYPERISAVTIMSGAAPMTSEEVTRLADAEGGATEPAAQDWHGVFDELAVLRDTLLTEADAPFLPEGSPAIMRDPAWQRMYRESTVEALRQGAEGWADEVLAIDREWDFEPGDIRASVTWWHGDGDKIIPLTAVQRAVDRIPRCELRTWRNEGHFAFLVHEREVLAEVLSRSNG